MRGNQLQVHPLKSLLKPFTHNLSSMRALLLRGGVTVTIKRYAFLLREPSQPWCILSVSELSCRGLVLAATCNCRASFVEALLHHRNQSLSRLHCSALLRRCVKSMWSSILSYSFSILSSDFEEVKFSDHGS
ncbi:hypothetical protein Bca52824_031872 [Brassica carinata]|uniref:Uncharacterized protein n=1 Tax=Brassica carinata TaxID=52824 RepID=A0A8X7SBD7_BRACI|nr:hypothetical protein Bca52824_031872 [Brassica carinata]